MLPGAVVGDSDPAPAAAVPLDPSATESLIKELMNKEQVVAGSQVKKNSKGNLLEDVRFHQGAVSSA